MNKFFKVKNASITDEKVDAYVVPVSPYGYDGVYGLPVIMAKAAGSYKGFEDLNELAEKSTCGVGFNMGAAILTKSYGGNSKYFMNVVTVDTKEYDFEAYMHHVDPDDRSSQMRTIKKAIYNSIDEAIKNDIKSMALPLLGTGNSPKSVSDEQSIVAILDGLYSAEKDFSKDGKMPECVIDIYDEEQMQGIAKYVDMDSSAISAQFKKFTIKNYHAENDLVDVIKSKLGRD